MIKYLIKFKKKIEASIAFQLLKQKFYTVVNKFGKIKEKIDHFSNFI